MHLLTGIMKRGFDPAFCMDMPKPDRGLAGGVIRSIEEMKRSVQPDSYVVAGGADEGGIDLGDDSALLAVVIDE